MTRGYISRAFLYDQLFALLFIKHKREETVLDILTYMQLSTAGLLLVINSVVGEMIREFIEAIALIEILLFIRQFSQKNS